MTTRWGDDGFCYPILIPREKNLSPSSYPNCKALLIQPQYLRAAPNQLSLGAGP